MCPFIELERHGSTPLANPSNVWSMQVYLQKSVASFTGPKEIIHAKLSIVSQLLLLLFKGISIEDVLQKIYFTGLGHHWTHDKQLLFLDLVFAS